MNILNFKFCQCWNRGWTLESDVCKCQNMTSNIGFRAERVYVWWSRLGCGVFWRHVASENNDPRPHQSSWKLLRLTASLGSINQTMSISGKPGWQDGLTQCLPNVGPASQTVGQHSNSIALIPRVYCPTGMTLYHLMWHLSREQTTQNIPDWLKGGGVVDPWCEVFSDVGVLCVEVNTTCLSRKSWWILIFGVFSSYSWWFRIMGILRDGEAVCLALEHQSANFKSCV